MSKAKSAESKKSLSVTLTKSLAKRLPKQLANASGLGLKRIHQTVRLQDTPAIRGMINQIYFMVKVEEVE